MNITPSLVYWTTRMNAINGVLFTLLVLATVGVIACLAVGLGAATATKSPYLNESDAYMEDLHTSGKWILRKMYILVAVWCLTGIALILTPTTKELAAMYVIPAVAANEKVQTVGNRLYDLAVEWMEELRPAKKEEPK